VGGLTVWTLRLASAVAGVASVFLIYWVGARMFAPPMGLLAAGLLTLNPWHIQQSRWGHEAAISPLLVLLPIAMMLWANLPFDDQKLRRPRPVVAGLAGAVLGISCYGYPAVRLFLPAFVIVAIGATWQQWWQCLKTRVGAVAVMAMIIGVAVTLGPLAWKHMTEAETIGKRGKTTTVWQEGDSTGAKVKAVMHRYWQHFGPAFLFARGDRYEIQSPPGAGQFHWYMMPLMLLGLVGAATKARSSQAARILLVAVLVYPVGDCLAQHMVKQATSMHALRSLPGIWGLILLGAYGGLTAGALVRKTRYWIAIPVVLAMGIAVLLFNALYLPKFYGAFNRIPHIYHSYHVDLLKACEWLKSRFDGIDAVFVTTRGMNQPYIITLVGLSYDPHQWFADTKVVHAPGEWDVYLRYGKMHFMYPGGTYGWLPSMRKLKNNGRHDRVVLILRPEETRALNRALQLDLRTPAQVIEGPEGSVPLLVFDKEV
jgi:4-amino-4-deoxy-L-arabinose transferase-like glycosyltransferase